MRLVLATTVSILLAAPVAAQRMNVGTYGLRPLNGPKGPDAPAGVDFEQKLGGKLPLGLGFFDHLGRPVTLGEAAGGKPAALVLMYNRCPRLCSEVLTKLLEAVKTVRRNDPGFVAGEQFNLLVVSIDPKDFAEGGLRKRRGEFLKAYDGRGEDAPGVTFLSASHGQGTDLAEAEGRIHDLADAVGFRYTLLANGKDYSYDAANRRWLGKDGPLPGYPREYDFQHPPGVVFVAPDGTVTRYLLGLDYKSTTVRQAVVEASSGTVGGLADKVAFYCFAYDDVKGHYRPTMKVLAFAAAPFGLLVLGLAAYTVRTARREGRLPAASAVADPLTPGGL